jgi:TIR domain
VAALKVRGFEVRIDRQDLPQLEDWERELLDFIRQADSVVLIVSPHSLASQVVEWELEQVRLNRKRLAPVMIADIVLPREIALAALGCGDSQAAAEVRFSHRNSGPATDRSRRCCAKS